MLDLIELDMGYTTLTDEYYRTVAPQLLLDGARAGLQADLHARGIADAHIPMLRARADGRGVVPAIEQQVGKLLVRFGARIAARDLVYAAIRGELAALRDPYTVLFTKPELTGFTTALDGRSFGGIGVVVTVDATGSYRADQVFADGPAAHAGLAAGDRIIAVDGRSIAGIATSEIETLLRGPAGSSVRITVRRDAGAALRELSMTRANISPPDVTARLLPPDVAYIGLRGFGPNAGPEVHAALADLRRQGARATVFDLRGNGGGYESSAVRVASAFIARGAVMLTQSKHGRRRTTNADGTALAAEPLAVLVDHDSASGSELVAGAIQDRAAGTVIGTQTFGKGLVQTMFPLPDGAALKVTTARYFTPHGRDIDHLGIAPDQRVEEPPAAVRGVPGRDPQLDAALTLLAGPQS